MGIDVSYLDRLTQKVRMLTPTTGVIETFDGSTLVDTYTLSNVQPGQLPSEVSDIQRNILVRLADRSGGSQGHAAEHAAMGVPLPKVSAMAGVHRVRPNDGYTTGASGVMTSHFKVEAEAPFSAVRIWYGEKNTSGTMPVIEALIASTDTGEIDSVANCCLPRVAGTSYNAMVTTTYGWRRVTFDNGSNSKSPIVAPVASNSASLIVSDWIPCRSIPRSDVAGGRPMLVARVANTGAGVYTQAVSNLASTYNSGRGQSFYREFIAKKETTDGINTLGNIPAAPFTNAQSEAYAWFEFLYDAPSRHVAVVGDSTMASAASTYGTSWPLIALRELSTQSAPIGVMNLAGSGHSHTQYLALLDGILNGGAPLTDVVFQGWSQNGFGQNHKGAEDLIGRDMQYLLKLRAADVRVWMTTSYGVNGYAGAGETARLECIAAIKTWAAVGLVTLIDTDAMITDYSGGNGILKAEYNSGDNVHANYAGQRVMADLLKSIWR